MAVTTAKYCIPGVELIDIEDTRFFFTRESLAKGVFIQYDNFDADDESSIETWISLRIVTEDDAHDWDVYTGAYLNNPQVYRIVKDTIDVYNEYADHGEEVLHEMLWHMSGSYSSASSQSDERHRSKKMYEAHAKLRSLRAIAE